MTYEESFLSVCNEDGIAPDWAVRQIFEEHGSDLAGFQACHEHDWKYGLTILDWLGY